MTRPLGKQINDPRTKHTRLNFIATPGSTNLVVPAATLQPLTITKVPGGSEESIHPQVLGTNVEPFATSAGDQISIQIDGGLIIPITFASTDTTAGDVVTRINTNYGSTIASVVDGKIFLQSNGIIGADGVMGIQNVVGVPLSKFGLTAGETYGISSSARGILTVTKDGLGGYTPLRLPGAQSLVTDADEFIVSSDISGDITYNLGVPGGQPIHARLSYNGTDYIFSYFTRLPPKSFVKTKASKFATLDLTDSINLTVTYNDVTTACVVDFPSPPYTRDGVVNRINSVWASTAFGTNGSAFIKTAVSQPYDFNTETVYISINGAPEVAVVLDPSDRTAQNVLTKFAAVSNITVNTVTEANGIYLTFQTATGVGFNSTISIRNSDSPGNNALSKLGITPGVYKGPYIARPDGVNDILITSHNRGSKSTLLVSATVQTLDRMGLVGVTGSSASDTEVDVPVNLPNLTTFGRAKGTYLLDFLVPEVVSFGEIPTDTSSIKEEFDNFSTGSNTDLKRDAAIFNGTQSSIDVFRDRGQDAGKVVTVGPDGLIDFGQLGHVTNYVDRFFKQFLAGNFSNGKVDALVASELRTPGHDANPLAEDPEFDVRIDWNDNFSSAQRSFNIIFGTNSADPGYEFRENFGIVQRGIRFGQGFDANESPTIPRIQYDLNDSFTFSQLTETNTPSSSYSIMREYANLGFNTLNHIRTVNANYSTGSIYDRDNTFTLSSRTRDGNSSGFDRATFSGAGVATVDDASWITRFRFPNSPFYPGGENEITDMLRIGSRLIDLDSAFNAMTPRIITDEGSQTRTLLWEVDNDYGGPTIRVYAVRSSVHLSDTTPLESGFEITKNARWRNDTGPQVWQVDSTSSEASKLYIGQGGFHFKSTGSAPPSTFDDTDTVTGWHSGESGTYPRPHTALIWRNSSAGFARVINDHPGPFIYNNNSFHINDFVKGSLHANLIPKMSGKIRNEFGTITQIAGYGVGLGYSVGTNHIALSWPVAPDNHNEVVMNVTVTGAGTNNNVKCIPTPTPFGINFYIVNDQTANFLALSTVLFTLDFNIYYVAS